MEPAERHGLVGNTIYYVIQDVYGFAAGKIVDMLLEASHIEETILLVINRQYLMQKANEAWTLLQQQPDPAQLQAMQQQ